MGYFKCTILFNICTISFLSYYDIAIGCTGLHNMFMVLLHFALGNINIGATKPIFLDSGSPRGAPRGEGGFVRAWAWFVIFV